MNNTVFVGSISWGTTEDSLQSFFESTGEVQEIKIIKDRETGRSRGFGFVTFASEEDAAKAIEELNGKDLDGRELIVSLAKQREERD
ncbi:MAG: RNA-binding protein [Candidatus Dojkabacteria bacterium]|nr:RNA-binding protein [Candidatus Dojkabacteria bacterium]MDQ7021807.1 RNA-binding protein [Candidatus Dojkabacteria bacterium]